MNEGAGGVDAGVARFFTCLYSIYVYKGKRGVQPLFFVSQKTIQSALKQNLAEVKAACLVLRPHFKQGTIV